MKHTKEPWVVSSFYRCTIVNMFDEHVTDTDCSEDARRIVACVNACAGLGDPIEEITELKRQLTWRDVGEKPKEYEQVFLKKGVYFCKATFIDGGFYDLDHSCKIVGEGITWLPIPKK